MTTRIGIGDSVRPRALAVVGAGVVAVPDPDRVVHLQFRRYAGCPICHLHLRSIVRRHDEISAAGVAEVVVFHSGEEAIRDYLDELPFPVVADPDKELYAAFGVEASPRAVLDPRAWCAALRGVAAMRTVRGAVEKDEEHLGLPADFLIAPDGRVLARKYGVHADDQWSVDELLSLRAGAAR